MSRAFLLVLDSFGIGGAPDADKFGDAGADTLGHIRAEHCAARSKVTGRACAKRPAGTAQPDHRSDWFRPGQGLPPALHLIRNGSTCHLSRNRAFCLRYVEVSQRKGHALGALGNRRRSGSPSSGDIFPRAIPTFPPDLLDLRSTIGRAKIPGSPRQPARIRAPQIIDEFGEEHIQTGKPIFYTSADSVFQIAAHHEILFRPGTTIRDLCTEVRAKLGRSVST